MESGASGIRRARAPYHALMLCTGRSTSFPADDRVLVARAREGDARAFRSLVERHERRAIAIAKALVRDEEDARDVVQEAFVRVYRHLPAFQDDSSFFTWFYRIVSNLAIDVVRRPARHESIDDEREIEGRHELPFSCLEASDPLDALQRRELAERIRAALAELPSYHRVAIVMRELDGLSYEQMADRMHVRKGTVMSRLFHARRKLRLALQADRPRRSQAEPEASLVRAGKAA